MRRLQRSLVAVPMLIGLLSLGSPAASWATPGHQASPSVFCVKARAFIDPHHAHVGDSMSIAGSWENCSSQGWHFQYRFVLTAPCGMGFREHDFVRLPRRSGFAEAVGFLIHCRGTYRVTAEAHFHGQLFDRSTRRVHVRG